MTAWVRFSPPAFGVRNWYIMRHLTVHHKNYPDHGVPEESRGDAAIPLLPPVENVAMIHSSIQMVHLGVGIDTARYGHHVSFLGEDREPAAPAMPVSESGSGYEALAEQLENLYAQYPDAQFHVRIDAAGQYATNLECYLRSLGLPMTISVGQPKQNKDYHQAIFPKRKADATESLAMARFAIVERPAATASVSPEIYLLREIAGRLAAQG